MSNSFVVSNCFYDGTSGDPNPLCYVQGTVNGKIVWFAPAFFRYLMAANTAGQMQEALTSVMFNYYATAYGPLLAPIPNFMPMPTFPPSDAVAERTEGTYPVPPVILGAALIPPWVA